MNWTGRYIAKFAFVLTLAFGLATVASAVAPTAAFADSKTDKALQKALASAIEDYDMLEIQAAEKTLEDAISEGEKSGGDSAIIARLYMMLGVVQFASTRDEAATEASFVSALNSDANAQIEPVYATPELEKIYATAKTKAKPPAASGPTSLQHEQIATTDAGKPMRVVVQVPADMPVYKMFVLYRRFDAESFDRSELLPTSNVEFQADVPGDVIRTSQIDYFIIAEDRGGNIIAQIGNSDAPLNVVVLGSGDVTAEDPDKDKDKDKDKDPVPGSEEHQWVYVSLFGGTDIGILTGGTPTANPEREVSPGLAPAFAHVLLDFGVRITDSAHLGIFFRWQFAPAQDFSAINVEESGFPTTEEECLGLGLPGDCILGLKYKWVFHNTPGIKIYSSAGTGFGRVRNWLRLKESANSELCSGKEILSDGAGDFCYIRDTVRTGWMHAGVGGGIQVPLTDFMDFASDIYMMFLFPDTSINLDINAGFNFRF